MPPDEMRRLGREPRPARHSFPERDATCHIASILPADKPLAKPSSCAAPGRSLDHAARWRAVRARLNPHDALRRTLLELIEGPVVRITDAVVFADRGHRARERRR
jgi:hypothetical protein